MTLYSLKNEKYGIVYQCFNYKEVKAAKIMYESEYGPLKIHRVKYS